MALHIHQFEDKGLAHFSYLIVSESDRKAVVIDPARDPAPYLDALQAQGVVLAAVVETHPHADFVSSHAELAARTGALVLASSRTGATYPFTPFDDGDQFPLQDGTLTCLETPGHSPDSISILVYENAVPTVLFSGDTLFVGDVGRPDLRETAGAITKSREELAKMMYHTIHTKLLPLPDAVVVYPAHGAGSLCGKALSNAVSTTIGQERISNPSLQPMPEADFVALLLKDQPFVPKYFGWVVDMNRAGAPPYNQALQRVPRFADLDSLPAAGLVVDARAGGAFKAGHAKGAINIQLGGKFDTWLGSIVAPKEPFALVAETDADADTLLRRCAAIGYEGQVLGIYVAPTAGHVVEKTTDAHAFFANTEAYTVVDVRNRGEQATGLLFAHALAIPLPELRERVAEVPTDKPIMVHCAAGYRSAAAQSILSGALPNAHVYDLGEAIKTVQPIPA